MTQARAISKYLRNYAEPEANALLDFSEHYQQSLLIPVYRESAASLQGFCRFAEAHAGSLLILVVNRPEAAADTVADQAWAEQLLAQTPFNQAPFWQSKQLPMRCIKLANKSALLIVDRAFEGAPIPQTQGVGLARKIGADIVSQLIDRQQLDSPWIANTDADATLPDDYFEIIETEGQQAQLAALVFPFYSIFNDDSQVLASALYDFSLHYYVAGLNQAQSPYAYQTIGSMLVVHFEHYAQVRGFPKRAAAEDFYLLNKLAKTGRVHSLSEPHIQLMARQSDRVPFGTGPAVIKLAASENPLAMPLYHPQCFHYLRVWLQLLSQLCITPITITDGIAAVDANVDLDILLAAARQFKLQAALDHSYQHGKQTTTRQQHLQHWFDGFKTLKFIHWLRDNHFASLTYYDWLAQTHLDDNAITTEMHQLIALIQQQEISKQLAPHR
ncbi:MAG: hypothetical protein ACJAYG_002824 [Oceanicoccus sp.]|jgi:hypothetical protein